MVGSAENVCLQCSNYGLSIPPQKYMKDMKKAALFTYLCEKYIPDYSSKAYSTDLMYVCGAIAW